MFLTSGTASHMRIINTQATARQQNKNCRIRQDGTQHGKLRSLVPTVMTNTIQINTKILHRSEAVLRELSRQQGIAEGIALACRITLGTRPARKDKGDLVNDVRNVVEHVEEDLIHGSEQVAEEVAKWVDAPAD